jgi:hypothetical protein
MFNMITTSGCHTLLLYNFFCLLAYIAEERGLIHCESIQHESAKTGQSYKTEIKEFFEFFTLCFLPYEQMLY